MTVDYSKLTKAELIRHLAQLGSELSELRDANADADALSHELHVHQVELEAQNCELVEAQQLLEESRDRYADLYDFAPVGYVTLDMHGKILDINLRGAAMLGRERSELLGKPFQLWVEKGYLQPFFEHLNHAFEREGKQVADLQIKQNDGRQIDVSMRSIAARRKQDNALVCRAALIDVTERRAFERARHLAHHDHLTNLPNRTLMQDRLEQALAVANRNDVQVGVLFVDLDRFKQVNDSLGHAAGDLLLQAVAERLMSSVRKIDTVARLGGDEFLVVLPSIKHAQDAALVAESILASMAQPFSIEDHILNVGASIGISIFPDDGSDPKSLLRNADAAMYHAKQMGNGMFDFYTPEMNARALKIMSIENGLRHAREREEFELHYQPQLEIETGRITGIEALIRWQHPQLGWVMPTNFISIAEERGLIENIFDWVLRVACAQNLAWQQAGFTAVPMAVNVCARQLQRQGFAEMVSSVLKEIGLDPHYLELEITEGVLVHDPEAAASTLVKLKDLGVRVSIDDFGTGYSSLSYLARLPLHKLKIADVFIRDISTSKEAVAIITAIINLAKSLGLRVIAEGVETEEQFTFLRSRQCDEMQGFYFSTPVTAQAFGQLLLNEQAAP